MTQLNLNISEEVLLTVYRSLFTVHRSLFTVHQNLKAQPFERTH